MKLAIYKKIDYLGRNVRDDKTCYAVWHVGCTLLRVVVLGVLGRIPKLLGEL